MGQRLAYAGLLTALIYLIFFQLVTVSQMQSAGPAAGSVMMRKLSAVVAKAADGRGIAYHIQASPMDWVSTGEFFGVAYFNLIYQQFPAPVMVGDGRSIINSAGDLQQADHLQSDAWLHAHQVATTFTLIAGDQNGPQVLIHRVP